MSCLISSLFKHCTICNRTYVEIAGPLFQIMPYDSSSFKSRFHFAKLTHAHTHMYTQVGLATNWIALKEIFEPIVPTPFMPSVFGNTFMRHGRFMMRQLEVSRDFADYMTSKVRCEMTCRNEIGGYMLFVNTRRQRLKMYNVSFA